ncbi:MAG: U32 family peptidase, partial [Clostridia bacterium]|nr:U32 family peptidase [Clostridia bacterium]
MKRPEILSPAGNFEKMKAAILYGADAVYLAGNMFGMRAAADNFSLDELREAVKYAHEHNVRVYLTVNTMPREYEYEALRKYFSDIKDMGIDALIIADVGVLMLAKEMLPDTDIHISTQANATSAAACKAWYSLGAKRVVLARELSLEEIKAIKAGIPDDLEIECFIHGSMCISYSGRCLLSGHMVNRDANRGACAQPCRWNFKIKSIEIAEEKREDIPI